MALRICLGITGFDRQAIAPATLTVAPFPKTDFHLHLPAQLILDRSPAGRICLLDSTLGVMLGGTTYALNPTGDGVL